MSDSRPAGLFDLESPVFSNNNANINNKNIGITETKISDDEILRHFPTRDEKIYSILEIAKTIAPTKVPILISSESACGKEQLAKTIHIASGKDRGRFIIANSASIPSNFFEIELFNQNNKNYNEFSNLKTIENCTILLDEISELDINMQQKLIKILKEQELNKGIIKKGTASDARIIACTSKNLQDEANAGKFKADLLYKLHIIHLEIPPLRARQVDIEFYADLFIKEFNTNYNKNTNLSLTAKQALKAYTWPGNIRELKNVIQRAVLLSTRDQITIDELHLVKANSRTELALSESLPQLTLAELEQRLILQTLRRMSGNRTHTAKALGISLRALRYKLNELVECGFEVEGKNA